MTHIFTTVYNHGPVQIQIFADMTSGKYTLENINYDNTALHSKVFFYGDVVERVGNLNEIEEDALARIYEATDAGKDWKKTMIVGGVKKSTTGENYFMKVVQGDYRLVRTMREYVSSSTDPACADSVLRTINPLSIGGVVEVENKVIFKSRSMPFLTGMWEAPPGGYVDFVPNRGTDPSRAKTLEETLFTEIREELQIEREEVESFVPIGIHRAMRRSMTTDVDFYFRTGLSEQKLLERFERAKGADGGEHDDFQLVTADEKILKDYLVRSAKSIADSSLGRLALYYKMKFGESAQRDLLEELRDDVVLTKGYVKILQ